MLLNGVSQGVWALLNFDTLRKHRSPPFFAGALGHAWSEAPYIDDKQTTAVVIGAGLAKCYGHCVLRSA
jgi:hypothetical protein